MLRGGRRRYKLLGIIAIAVSGSLWAWTTFGQDPPEAMAFDASGWNPVVEEATSLPIEIIRLRTMMTHDLLSSRRLLYRRRDEVESLLGAPRDPWSDMAPYPGYQAIVINCDVTPLLLFYDETSVCVGMAAVTGYVGWLPNGFEGSGFSEPYPW